MSYPHLGNGDIMVSFVDRGEVVVANAAHASGKLQKLFPFVVFLRTRDQYPEDPVFHASVEDAVKDFLARASVDQGPPEVKRSFSRFAGRG